MRCSVAMSTYNGERFLREQLESVLRQTHPVDELVISDDGSSDGTMEIIRELQSAHPEISWRVLTSSENQGFRKSFRRSIMNCSGDVIFLCDQDDVWTEGKVERTLDILDQNPQILSLISDFKTIDASGRLLNPEKTAENLWVSQRVMDAPSMPSGISLSEMLGRNQGQGCTMAIRSALAREYIDLEQTWTHDWILNLLAAMHGGLYYCREQLMLYRLHGANVIGMAQGEHARRRVSPLQGLHEWALVFRYSFLEGDGEACRRNLLSVTMDKYEFVFDHVSCEGGELAQREAWKALQKKRLRLIREKKPAAYLLFWLGHQRFFEEIADFATHEQKLIRLMADLCAMLR